MTELERETLRMLRELYHTALELMRYGLGSPSQLQRLYEQRHETLLEVRALRRADRRNPTTQRAIADARAGRLTSTKLRKL